MFTKEEFAAKLFEMYFNPFDEGFRGTASKEDIVKFALHLEDKWKVEKENSTDEYSVTFGLKVVEPKNEPKPKSEPYNMPSRKTAKLSFMDRVNRGSKRFK